MKIQIITLLTAITVVACSPVKQDEQEEQSKLKQEERMHYTGDGVLKKYIKIDYDENDRKIKGSYYNINDDLLWYWVFEYENEQIVKAVVYHGNDEVSVQADIVDTPTGAYYTYEYEDTVLSKVSQYTANGTVISYSTREYEDGFMTKETWHTADGTMTYYCKYDRDETNRIMKGNFFDYKDQLGYYETYEYEGDILYRINRINEGGENLSYKVIREI